MKRYRPRFGLLTLLALPAMFALGWWARGLNYKRDVYNAAEKIAEDSGGIFIPELGMIRGRANFSARYRSLSPASKEELSRRLTYYKEAVEPTFDPPKPGVIESVKGVFSATFFGDDASPQDADSGPADDETPVDSAEIQRRIEFFRQLRDGTKP